MKRKDANEIVYAVVQQAIGAFQKAEETRKSAAAKLGRRGGIKGGMVRAAVLSDERKKQIAKKAAEARWGKKRSK